MDLRPTTRGWALAVAGAVATVVAVALGSEDLARAGSLLVVLVVVSAVAATVEHHLAHRNLQVRRTITPSTLSVDRPGHVTVHITPMPGHRAQLGRLRLRERAAVELSNGQPIRATVTRRPRELALAYGVHASRRGRWPIGPITATVGDPFGLFTRSQTLGRAVDVAVWPRVVDLDVPPGGLSSDPDTAARGARTPSADDASLRVYRPGDDLRRVHWASSAKRGTLLVRNDERSGKRPVTVLLDLPVDDAGVEWSISLAASIALAMLRSGHPVRFLPTGDPGAAGPRLTQVHAHPPRNDAAVASLLDATIDLAGPITSDQGEAQLLDAAEVLATHDPSETVIAVVGPMTPQARTALAAAVGPGHGWAVIRTHDASTAETRTTQDTRTALLHAGWWTSLASPTSDLTETWDSLVRTRP
jgi:uncharacterized protein (DUF58 family)